MKNKKHRYVMYPAWEYRREAEDLNKFSEEGWQLEKGGCFHSVFYRDENARYRYALDYNQSIDDPVRYRDTFAEQGWEFVSDTFNGWHFFRKKYDPALPPAEYEIYTDEQSVRDMAGRWSRLGTTLGAIELAVTVLNAWMAFREPSVTGILTTLACLMLGVTILTGARRIRRQDTDRPRKSLRWCFALVFLLLAVGLVYSFFRIHADSYSEYVYDPAAGPWTWSFDVHLPDFYTLDAEADTDAMVDITVTDKDGKISAVFGGGQDLRARAAMFLMPGTYDVAVQYAPDTPEGTAGMFRFEVD